MKKLLVALFASAALFSSCESDKTDGPADDGKTYLTFSQADYTMAQDADEVSVVVKLTKQDGTTPVTAESAVTVTLDNSESTAVIDENYTLPGGLEVTIPAGESSATITVARGETRDLTNNKVILKATAAGTEAGTYTTATVTLDWVTPQYRVTFASSAISMSASVSIEVSLSNYADDSYYTAPEDMVIPLQIIDTMANAAVEGENFQITGGECQVIIPEGRSSGTMELTTLSYDPDKNVILIVPVMNDLMAYGQFRQITVTMMGELMAQALGTWKYVSSPMDAAWWESVWLGMYQPDEVVYGSTNDLIEITETEFKTTLESELSWYFRETSGLTPTRETTLYLDNNFPTTTRVYQEVELSNVNRYFSATQTSTETKAYLALYPYTDGGKQMLEIAITDYNPKEFFTDADYMFQQERPTAEAAGCALRYVFEKVEE